MISRRKVKLRCGPRTRQCGGRCLPLGLFCRGDVNGTVRSLEDSIKDKSIEHLYLIDARTGELKAKGIGDKYSVSIPSEKWIKGNIITHNHPPLVSDRSSAMYKGQSLSVHDVILAARYDAKEIRAVTTAYRHSMSPKGKWADEKALADSYKRHYDRTVNKMRWDIAFGDLSVDEANASLWHEINKKVAKEMNMNYTRTTLGGFRVDAVEEPQAQDQPSPQPSPKEEIKDPQANPQDETKGSKEMPPTDEASLADLSDKISRLAYAIISRSYKKRIDRFVSIDPVSESVLSGTFVSEGKVVGFTIDIDKQNVETWHPQFQKQDNKMCTVGLSCGNSCVNKSKKCNLGLSQIASPEEIAQLKSLTTDAFNVFKVELQRQYMEFQSATGLRGVLPHLKFAIDRIGIEQKLKAGEAVLSEQSQTPFLASRKGNNAKRDLIMDAYFASHHPDKVGSLEVEDVAAIRSYARPLYYKWTNSILRGNKENLNAVSEHPYVKGFYSGEKEIIEAGKAHISALEKALSKLDSHDGIVYRGLELPEDLIQTTLKKGQWIENGFMSTTKDKGKMYPGNTIMEIRSRNGKDISRIEPLPNDEVLFNRGTALKLVSHRTSKNKGKTMYHLVFDELMRTDSEPVRVDTDAATLGRAKTHLQQLTYRILSRSYRERIDRFVSMDTPTLEMVSGSFISRGRLVGFSLDLSKNKVSTWIVKDRRIDRLDAFRKIQKSKCETGLPCGTTCISKKNKCTVALGTIANASEIRQAKQLTTFLRQETSPPAQPPSSIRDLRKIASAKGVVRYSRMNKSELEAAIKAVDSPAASRQRLQDTLKKKEIATLFATKNALSDYAKDWNTFQKIMAVSGTVGAPALLTAFAYLQGRPQQEAEKIVKDYEAAYGSMAKSAEQEAAKINVAPTEKPAILFVVGGYHNEGSYAQSIKKELNTQANANPNNANYQYLTKDNEIYTFDQEYQPDNTPPGNDRFGDKAENSYNLPHKMFLYHNAIKGYFYQRGDVMRQLYEGITGKGSESPRNEDAQRLAAQIYATAKAGFNLEPVSTMDESELLAEYKKAIGNDFPASKPNKKELEKVILEIRTLRLDINKKKPINILAHGAGGGTAREAIEILSRMGADGEQIAKRVNMVSLSSPTFNLTDVGKKVALEKNFVARNDPFAPVAGKRRFTVPRVKNRESKTFLQDGYTIEKIAEFFDRFNVEKSKFESDQGMTDIHAKWLKAAAKAAAKAANQGGTP